MRRVARICWRIGREVVHASPGFAEGLVRLGVARQNEGRGQLLQAGVREEGVRRNAEDFGDAVLEQPVYEDDVRTGKIVDAAAGLHDVRAEVRDELQAKRTHRSAGVAAGTSSPRTMFSSRFEYSK